MPTTTAELIAGNRAGPDESELTFDELVAYVMNPPTEGG